MLLLNLSSALILWSNVCRRTKGGLHSVDPLSQMCPLLTSFAQMRGESVGRVFVFWVVFRSDHTDLEEEKHTHHILQIQ